METTEYFSIARSQNSCSNKLLQLSDFKKFIKKIQNAELWPSVH